MKQSHLHALQTKHDRLEHKIHEEVSRPWCDDIAVRRLKEQRLHVCEEIERCRRDTS